MQNTESKLTSFQGITRRVNNISLNEAVVVEPDMEIGVQGIKLPVRVDALLMILCTEGHGRVGIDLREYDLRPNTVVIIQPQNYVHYFSSSSGLKGNILACSRQVVENVIPRYTELLPLLLHHRTDPVTYLSEKDAAGLQGFLTFLRAKINGPQTQFKQRKVICMLQAVLFEMLDVHYSKADDSMLHRSRKEEIMARFILAVSENFRQHREVAWYAEQLCITPKHLSNISKETSGRTAGDWIESYITLEAKVLLKTTDLSVQEIAMQMGFSNQSYFGKYFRRQTGITPSAFRRDIQ